MHRTLENISERFDFLEQEQIMKDTIGRYETTYVELHIIPAYDEALKGLEEIGWPCRLQDLPQYCKELTAEINRLRKEIDKLKQRQ